MPRDFTFVLLRGLALSVLALALSFPLVRAFHNHFGLGAPPFNGMLLMLFALIVAFVGSALVGALTGTLATPRKSFLLLVGGGGLVWGLGVLIWFVPFYAGMVADDLMRSSASIVIRDRNDLVPRAKSAIEAFQNGQSEKARREIIDSASPRLGEVGRFGLAQVPALTILAWALLVPPWLAMWEYRKARQRSQYHW